MQGPGSPSRAQASHLHWAWGRALCAVCVLDSFHDMGTSSGQEAWISCVWGAVGIRGGGLSSGPSLSGLQTVGSSCPGDRKEAEWRAQAVLGVGVAGNPAGSLVRR